MVKADTSAAVIQKIRVIMWRLSVGNIGADEALRMIDKLVGKAKVSGGGKASLSDSERAFIEKSTLYGKGTYVGYPPVRK